MFTPVAGGRGELFVQDTPHTSWGEGEGEGRPLRSPREQRVSVAGDSSKETQGNKCATNRWGGYLGKDAARRAGSQPPPRRLPGAQGTAPGTPSLGGAQGAAQGPSWGRLARPCAPGPGDSILTDTAGVLCWVTLLGRGTLVQGAAHCVLLCPFFLHH